MAHLTHQRVVNLSDFELTEHHISLLERGLKFCPTPSHPNAGDLREDMDRVHKRLRQIAFFNKDDDHPLSINDSATTTSLPVSNNLNSTSPFKHRNFKLLSEPFTIENGTLTPKLSIRRHVVERTYSDLIDQMYDRL